LVNQKKQSVKQHIYIFLKIHRNIKNSLHLRLKGTIKNLKKNKSFELFFNFNLNHSFLKTYKQFHSFKKSKNKKATVF